MKWLKGLLPIVVLAVGVLGLVMLVRTRPEPAKKPIEHLGELVETQPLRRVSRAVTIEAHGTVTPSRRVVIQPEVTGRVTWLNEQLVPGGRVAAGTPLLRVDARDYRLAVKQQRSTVEQAELQLKLEQMQHRVAQDEWAIIGEDERATPEGRAIALRQPQLETARASLAAARSARERAELNVGRTTVNAPFDAWVQSENVELGQLVSPQTQAATLIGTEAYWIQVAVSLEALAHISIPGLRGVAAEDGALATVTQGSGKAQVSRQGRVVRLLGDLDPAGRMARLLVEVQDPLGGGDGSRLPLLLGAFVSVQLAAGNQVDVFELPARTVQDGDRVLLYSDGKLETRRVNVAWRTADVVLASSGLREGERLITSRVASPVSGMRLRLAGDDGAAVAQERSAPGKASEKLPAAGLGEDAGPPRTTAAGNGG